MGNRFGGSPLGSDVNKSMGTYAETTGVFNGVLGALNSLNVPEGSRVGGKTSDGSSSIYEAVDKLVSVGGKEGNSDGGKSSKPHCSSLVSEAVNNGVAFGGKERNHDGGKSSKPNCSSLVSEAVNNGVAFGGKEGNRDGGRSSTPNGSSLVSEAANNGVSFGGKEVEQLNDPTSFEQTFVEGEEDCGGDQDLGHDKGETMNVVVEHDGNVVRKSKRQRVVPPVLKGFQLDCRTLGFVKALMFGFDLKADYVAKFADLEELLKLPCIVSLGNGSSLNNKDNLEIAGRTKIMGAKSMDALMHYTSVPYHKQSHCTVDKKIQFFDTKSTSLLMKHFTKFSRIAAKDKEIFVFQENLIEYFVNDGGRNGIGERFYFPFNLDKQHWVGVCVDINQKAVFVLDCNLSFRTDSLIKKDLLPVAQMVPYVMKGVMKERKLFSLERVCGIPHTTFIRILQ